jgi:hypothetical protein
MKLTKPKFLLALALVSLLSRLHLAAGEPGGLPAHMEHTLWQLQG